MRNFLRHKGLHIFLGLSLLILLLILTGILLIGHTPAFYKDFSSMSQRELQFRRGRLFQDLLDVASLVSRGREFQLEIREDDLNSLLAEIREGDLNSFLAAGALRDWPDSEDFSLSAENLQAHFLSPKGTEKGLGQIILAVKVGIFHLDTIISVHCRLSKRGQGFRLKVEKLRAGALPIPQRFFKNIISEIEDTRFENTLKEVEIKDLRLEEGLLRIVGRGRPDGE